MQQICGVVYGQIRVGVGLGGRVDVAAGGGVCLAVVVARSAAVVAIDGLAWGVVGVVDA
jgi:hypothetical protein